MSYNDDMGKSKKREVSASVLELLRKARESRGLTQVQWAKHFKIKRSYVSTTEGGHDAAMPWKYVQKIWLMLTPEEKNEIEEAMIRELKAKLRGEE